MIILNIIVIAIVLGVLFAKYEDYKPINKTNFLRFNISVIVRLLKIIVVFWLFWLFIGLLALTSSDMPLYSKPCPENKASCKSGYKKDLSVVIQSIEMDKALQGTDAGTCSNEKALAELFLRRLNVLESYKSPNKQTLKILAKDKLSDKPYIMANDGTLFIIVKVNGHCGSNESSNPKNANCVMMVDVNGIKPPNELSTGTQESNYKFKDRYLLIVLKDKAIPASNSENNIADYIINN